MEKHCVFTLNIDDIKEAIKNYMSYKEEWNVNPDSITFIHDNYGEVVGITIEDYK